MFLLRVRGLWLLVLLANLTWPSPSLFAQQPVPWMETLIVSWTNSYRQQAGRGPLQVNPRLSYAARLHAWTMAQRDQMGHNVDGTTCADRVKLTGYTYQYIGENVAYNEGYPDPAWKFFEGWMNSSGHWQNIQHPVFTEIGVGVYRSASGKFYACQVFGTPAPGPGLFFHPLTGMPPVVVTVEPPVSSPAATATAPKKEVPARTTASRREVSDSPTTPVMPYADDTPAKPGPTQSQPVQSSPITRPDQPPPAHPPAAAPTLPASVIPPIYFPPMPPGTIYPAPFAPLPSYPPPLEGGIHVPGMPNLPNFHPPMPAFPEAQVAPSRNWSIPRRLELSLDWDNPHPEYYRHPWWEFPGW